MTWSLELDLDVAPLATVTRKGRRVSHTANGRGQWHDRHRHARDVRTAVAWHARAVTAPAPEGPVAIRVTLWAPDRRRRDHDNLAPAAKPILDALVDAGIIPDDAWPHVTEVTYRTRPRPDAPGWSLELTEAPA